MKFTVVSNHNLTALCSHKAIYHLVLAPAGEPAGYQPGDWLTLQAHNPQAWVDALLSRLRLSGDEPLALRRVGEVTAREALRNHLEISQLNPAILNKLQRQHGLGDWADRQAMIDYAYGRDILDLLEAFPSLAAQGVDFLTLLAPLAPRYYSIASAPVAVGEQVHLLVKQVVYPGPAPDKRLHYGVASYAVSQLVAGDEVHAQIKSNPTFKLPEDPATPIIMIGAGTGLAPFIGFMQQRTQQAAGGENVLFFGETHRTCAFLFERELSVWQAQGKLQLHCAFSRDQAHKCYVQHRLWEQREAMWARMRDEGAVLYLCGSQFGLAQAVTATWLQILQTLGGYDEVGAQQQWQAWRESRRVQLDVY